jgi:hypothetical protein
LATERVDPGDRGGEYRSLLGLPGGTGHTSFPAVEEAAKKYGYKLVAGKGNDPDTLGKQLVYVYDTKTFPFYQAEVYHQVSDPSSFESCSATRDSFFSLSGLAFVLLTSFSSIAFNVL